MRDKKTKTCNEQKAKSYHALEKTPVRLIYQVGFCKSEIHQVKSKMKVIMAKMEMPLTTSIHKILSNICG